MITVVSVLRSRGIYTPWNVERLRKQVSANMASPHRFVCLSDINVSYDRIPLTQGWPGWWSKIELWRHGVFTGRVLYFDLDVTITGSLDELVATPGSFVICRDWGRFGYNSSVMCWDAGTADRLYTDFAPIADSVMNKLHGDQDWITLKKPDAAKFPRDWCYSYKLGLKTGFPKDMKVCVYHGVPKPWNLPEGHLEGLRG